VGSKYHAIGFAWLLKSQCNLRQSQTVCLTAVAVPLSVAFICLLPVHTALSTPVCAAALHQSAAAFHVRASIKMKEGCRSAGHDPSTPVQDWPSFQSSTRPLAFFFRSLQLRAFSKSLFDLHVSFACASSICLGCHIAAAEL
jgi:hypothetical protein